MNRLVEPMLMEEHDRQRPHDIEITNESICLCSSSESILTLFVGIDFHRTAHQMNRMISEGQCRE